jgi:hypothetical protein
VGVHEHVRAAAEVRVDKSPEEVGGDLPDLHGLNRCGANGRRRAATTVATITPTAT